MYLRISHCHSDWQGLAKFLAIVSLHDILIPTPARVCINMQCIHCPQERGWVDGWWVERDRLVCRLVKRDRFMYVLCRLLLVVQLNPSNQTTP